MEAGKFYQFVFTATNVVGNSAYSQVVTLPLADAPDKPAQAPQLISSDKTSISVRWSRALDTQTPAGTIIGHHLYVDDGNSGDYSLAFSGKDYPAIVTYTVTGLTTGLPYRFYIVSENFVGLSEQASDVSTHYACEAPSD